MRHRKFVRQLEHERIHAAIHAAEEKSSGEIRVMVSHKAAPDPLATAQEAFLRLGMQAPGAAMPCSSSWRRDRARLP